MQTVLTEQTEGNNNISNEQTLQVPGALRQSSENISSSLSSTSLAPLFEYNNSKYGFKIQYPSDWKVNSTVNDSLSSPPITGASTDVVANITSPSDLQRGRQGLVTVSVENLSEAASSKQMEILQHMIMELPS